MVTVANSFLISAALDQDVQDVAILIHRSPQIMNASVNLEEHFIKMPDVAWPRRFASQVVGISLAELETPFSDRLIRECNAAHGIVNLNL